MFESQRDHHFKTNKSKIRLRSHRLARSRTSPFHGGNRGSNPLGSTKVIQATGNSGFFFAKKIFGLVWSGNSSFHLGVTKKFRPKKMWVAFKHLCFKDNPKTILCSQLISNWPSSWLQLALTLVQDYLSN